MRVFDEIFLAKTQDDIKKMLRKYFLSEIATPVPVDGEEEGLVYEEGTTNEDEQPQGSTD